MDVERYLKRIGYEGSREPTLENLEALSLAHKLAVPYSNLHYFGGPITNLDLEVLFDKIVVKGSGGTCYEINGLFQWLLRQLGYTATSTQANWFMPEYQEWSVPYFHMILLVHLDGDKYLVDPGFLPTGPIRVAHLSVHVETHNVYRAVNIPGKDGSWFRLERHKKTVLDRDGNVIKEGPAPAGNISGKCDEECCKVDSSHWVQLHTFSRDEIVELENFTFMIDFHHDPTKITYMQDKVIVHIYEPKSIRVAFGSSYTIKENVDPLTDKILEEKTFESDEDIEKAARDVFRVKVYHPVKFFRRGK